MTDSRRVPEMYSLALSEQAPEIPWNRQTWYENWSERQGIPIHRDFFIGNVRDLECGYWQELGANAALIALEGASDSNGAYIVRLRAGETTNWWRRAYEEVFYVIEGSGSTQSQRDGEVITCFWQTGSLFTVPINEEYRHTATGDTLLYCVTAAPLVMNLFHDADVVFNNQHRFSLGEQRFADFFSEWGIIWRKPRGAVTWQTNFVRDCRTIPLPPAPHRGGNGDILSLQLGENALVGHISEFPVGVYKKAHRHGPGAHVLTLNGLGYSLLWQGDVNDRVRVDWSDGAVLVPPSYWYHQHFNIGTDAARYLAIRWGSAMHPLDHSYDKLAQDRRDKGDQIEYDDQHPLIDEIFRQERLRLDPRAKLWIPG